MTSSEQQRINNILFDAKTAEETKKALDLGAYVNAKDEYGRTPLMKATTAEQTKLLIRAGANVNAKDKHGRTALDLCRDREQVKVLLDAGAVFDEKDLDEYVQKMVDSVLKQRRIEAADLKMRLKPKHLDELEMLKIERDSKKHVRRFMSKRLDELAQEQNKLSVDEKIKEIKNRLEKLKQKMLSGVGVADKIAEKKISGEIKGDITPEQGRQLRTQIIRERVLNGKK